MIVKKEVKKMKKMLFIIIFFIVATANALELKEGLWEMSSKIEMKGMPVKMPVQKFKQCITKDKAVPIDTQEKDMKCKVVEQKISGNTIYWKIICKDKEGETVITGKGTYKSDKFEGETKIKTQDGTEMIQHISGEWIGKCK
jgi:hypothetical protein